MHIKIKNFLKILAFWFIFFGSSWIGKEFGLLSRASKATNTFNKEIETLISFNSN